MYIAQSSKAHTSKKSLDIDVEDLTCVLMYYVIDLTTWGKVIHCKGFEFNNSKFRTQM